MTKRLFQAAGLAAIMGLAGLGAAHAAIIPYPDPGTINSTTYTFTASATGDIDAYFYAASAGDTDYVEVEDLTQGTNSGFVFDNQTSSPGDELSNLLSVNAGDSLEFVLEDKGKDGTSTPTYLYSVASQNADGDNHIYSTAFSRTIPGSSTSVTGGTYIGWEDELASVPSDWDYNDLQFVFTDIATVASVPEPAVWTMLVFGIGAVGAALRVKRRPVFANV